MTARALWALHDAVMACECPNDCPDCGADEWSPSAEAFETTGRLVCEDCADAALRARSEPGERIPAWMAVKDGRLDYLVHVGPGATADDFAHAETQVEAVTIIRHGSDARSAGAVGWDRSAIYRQVRARTFEVRDLIERLMKEESDLIEQGGDDPSVEVAALCGRIEVIERHGGDAKDLKAEAEALLEKFKANAPELVSVRDALTEARQAFKWLDMAYAALHWLCFAEPRVQEVERAHPAPSKGSEAGAVDSKGRPMTEDLGDGRFRQVSNAEAHPAPSDASATERMRASVTTADDAPVWADGIVTDGERVAFAQKAEADYGGTYWATDEGDGALEWEPTHFIARAALGEA